MVKRRTKKRLLRLPSGRMPGHGAENWTIDRKSDIWPPWLQASAATAACLLTSPEPFRAFFSSLFMGSFFSLALTQLHLSFPLIPLQQIYKRPFSLTYDIDFWCICNVCLLCGIISVTVMRKRFIYRQTW